MQYHCQGNRNPTSQDIISVLLESVLSKKAEVSEDKDKQGTLETVFSKCTLVQSCKK